MAHRGTNKPFSISPEPAERGALTEPEVEPINDDTAPIKSIGVSEPEKLPENGAKITHKLPSVPGEASPQAARPKPKFSGKVGRQRSNDDVDEILDYIVVYGEPPKGLSRKMRLYYIRHERLEERRRKYARERKQAKGQTSEHASNVVPMRRRASGQS